MTDTALEVVLWVAFAVGAIVVIGFLVGRGD